MLRDPDRRRRVVLGSAAGLCVVAVAGAVTYGVAHAAAADALSDHYRLATASTGSVSSQLSLSGSVARVNQVSASFPSSGEVTGVDVAVGDTVSAGQKLATMDTSGLNADLLSAQADLAQAKAAAATTSTTTSTTTTSKTSSAGSTPSSTASSPAKNSSSGNQATRSSSGSSTPTPTVTASTPAASGGSGSGAKTSDGDTTQLKALSKTLSEQVRSMKAAVQEQQTTCAPVMAAGGSQGLSLIHI